MFFPAGITLILSGMLYEWADRKLVARFQNRIGPRWFQPLADTIKLLTKEEIKPQGLKSLLFYGLPVVALTGALTAALYAPILGFAPIYSFTAISSSLFTSLPADDVRGSCGLEWFQPLLSDWRDPFIHSTFCL
jgi:formate hydrogenlyase subunit 4